MKKKYWFYIDPFVHISVKKDAVLFYNTYTGKFIEYKNNPHVLRLVKRLKSPRNLNVILLKELDLENNLIKQFTENIRRYYMGDLIDASYSEIKPIQMPPIVKNKKDIKYLKTDSARSVGEDIMNYISEVFLYINDSCNQNCDICKKGYLQFPCCTSKKKRNLELNKRYLEIFFEVVNNSSPVNLNILGGDIFKYSKLKKLLHLIKSYRIDCTYYLHYLNVVEHKNELKALTGVNKRLIIPINFPIKLKKFEIALESVSVMDIDTEIMFIIQSENDFEKAKALISEHQIENPNFIPYYNGNNISLFENNVYIDKNDLETNRITLKKIYSNNSINSLNFGRLTIFPDCRVYANVNASCIGILGINTLYEIIFKEMSHGKSWRKIRKNVIPCKQCVYENLCPPISNYSYAIGKYSLCHIWKDKDNND